MRFLTCALALLCGVSFVRGEDKKYDIIKTLQVGGEGGWDYVTVDSAAHHVYVTRSSHTQVIDTESGQLVGDIKGQKRSHGVAVVSDLNRGFITDGGGAIVIFDLKTNEVLGKVESPSDSDGIIYDGASKKILVVCG